MRVDESIGKYALSMDNLQSTLLSVTKKHLESFAEADLSLCCLYAVTQSHSHTITQSHSRSSHNYASHTVTQSHNHLVTQSRPT